jgi:FAD/FMN-containing dehydrogenase
MAMEVSAEYGAKKQQLLHDLKQNQPVDGPFRLHKKTSNLFRHRQKTRAKWLDLTAFNRVIHVDPITLIAEVEGLVTYEDFVAETLKYHCLPAIVPELKSITVGGAIAGLGAESSSFKYGWVHETATEIEVLLSHGEVVVCTPENLHRDLFYALPSSYGTLGYVLKAKMRLIPAKPYIKISRLAFSDPAAYFDKLAELTASPAAGVDYIDGVGLAGKLFITLGEFVERAPYLSNYRYMNIYYQSIPQKSTDYLTALDYIWRWDPDWFWCSKYFLMQNKFFRFLLGKWLLKSTAYWQIMRFVNAHAWIRRFTAWISPKSETIIQDLQIPLQKAAEFYQFFKDEIHIDPMLVCPIKLNPHLDKFLFCTMRQDQIYINFGAYGNFIPSDQDPGYFNRLIEKKVTEYGGNKWLYSNIFYSEAEFWKLYDKTAYFSLKNKYDPQNRLRDLYAKCAEKIL